MGRKLAEATKACRMRRTRGEIGRRFRVVAAWGLTELVPGFLTGSVWLAGALLGCAVLRLLAAPGAGGFGGDESVWVGAELAADCCDASAGGNRATKPRITAASTDHFEPACTALIFRGDTLLPESCRNSSGGNLNP